MYDNANFLGGINYLAPSGCGTNLTGVWHPGDSVTNAVDATARASNTVNTAAIATCAKTSGVQSINFSSAQIEIATNTLQNGGFSVVIWKHRVVNGTNQVFFTSPYTGNNVFLSY